MANYGWYNANQYRDFPFIYKGYRPAVGDSLDDSGESLPRRAIVDFQCLFGPSARFVTEDNADARHVVYLYEIRRQDDVYSFEFRTNVSPADRYALIFDVPVAAGEGTIVQAEAVRIEEPESSDDGACDVAFIWEGCLVLGFLADLAMANDDVRTFNELEWQVEPALVQTTTFLQTISLANYDRTHAYENCSDQDFAPVREVFPNSQCLTGPLRFKEGYNCTIRQDDAANALIISAVAGAGAGQPCEEIKLYEDESLSSDGLLSGGPRCNEVITTLNGVGGRRVRLIAGAGITVEPDPDDAHALVVTVDLNDFTACLSQGSDGAT